MKYRDKPRVRSTFSRILQDNNRSLLQALANYEIPCKHVSKLASVVGKRKPMLFGLGPLREFLDVKPIVLQNMLYTTPV